jgi:hypothetical protein
MRQIRVPNDTICITVLPNQTFRGMLHYQEVTYNASDLLAIHAVNTGIAKYNFDLMTYAQLKTWHRQVLERPAPVLRTERLRELCERLYGSQD